ncbi:MAG TPA: putative metal-dependent hydrolase [Vicinamibacterales bacterium]|jgi:uncharacterized damage-inducible protein DinB
MTPLSDVDPRYPTGKLTFDRDVTPEKRRPWIESIRTTPAKLRAAATGLTDTQLDTPYREGGWTVRQVIHHVPESHANAFVRFKLALTEDSPTIKPYSEDAWAKLPDVARASIESSLKLVEALHERWVTLLDVMTDADFRRPLTHPERGQITLDTLLQIYAWHGPHHIAHVELVRRRT